MPFFVTVVSNSLSFFVLVLLLVYSFYVAVSIVSASVALTPFEKSVKNNLERNNFNKWRYLCLWTCFKNDFTHAIRIAKSFFKEEGMLLLNPSDKASVAFHAEILDIVNEYRVVEEEDLIMLDETDEENKYEEVNYALFAYCKYVNSPE